MRKYFKITKITGLLLVSFILLMLISSCGQPSTFNKITTKISDSDELTDPETTTEIQKEYEELINYISENGEQYLYKYAPNYDDATLVSFTDEVQYNKVIWEEHSDGDKKYDAITIKIGLAFSDIIGVQILSEFSYIGSDNLYFVRVITESDGSGTIEVVEKNIDNNRAALISFDAAHFNWDNEFEDIKIYGNDTNGEFRSLVIDIANTVLAYADEFIETEIMDGSLKTIGIGIDYVYDTSGDDTTYADGETAKVIAEFNLLDGDEVISFDTIKIKSCINGQFKTLDARVAIINSPTTVFGSVMYLDIQNENGAVICSKRFPGIGFIAFKDIENQNTEIIIYNLTFKENGFIFASSSVYIFTDATMSGEYLNQPVLVSNTNLSESVTFSVNSESEINSNDQRYILFSSGTANNFNSVKGARIMIYSDGTTASILHHTNDLIDDTVIKKIEDFTIRDVAALLSAQK